MESTMDVLVAIAVPVIALVAYVAKGTESNASTDASLTDDYGADFTQEYGEYDREDRDNYEEKEWGDKSGGTKKERKDLADWVGGNIEKRNKAKGLSIIPFAPYKKIGKGKKVTTMN